VLDTSLDAPLRREGVAREAINLFNTARKEQGLEVSDRIRVRWSCDDEEVAAALRAHSSLIAREILAVEFEAAEPVSGGGAGAVAGAIELAGARVHYSIARRD